jgi:hypothetical protein
LNELEIDFRLAIIGEQFSDIPDIFKTCKDSLKSKIDYWGFLPSKNDYYKVLAECDLIVSTSIHEFFGVSM